MHVNKPEHKDWLLFFYTLPSKPVNSRMRIWRLLVKAGAVQFKGSAYILPASDDHYELFQWLVSSVTEMMGEAAFIKVPGVESMKRDEIVALFDRQMEKEYLDLGNRLDEFENRVGIIGKEAALMDSMKAGEELQRFVKEFQAMAKIDFFCSKGGKELEKRLKAIASEIIGRDRAESFKHANEVTKRHAAEYQGKRWVTRKRPFIDRIASAWLIKGFIDKKAAFGFIDENEVEGLPEDTIAFDLVGAEFTHVGDLCTFEVLLKSFGLKDKTLGVVAEVVHQLDLQDGRYQNPAAEGLREILTGIRKTVKDDHEALERGMGIFEMLYAANK
jgi:hypothetical protein